MPKPGEIEHDSRQIYYRSPVGAAEAGSIIRIGIQLKTRETLSILLRTWSQHDGEKLVNMHTNEPIDAPERYYFADVQLPEGRFFVQDIIGCKVLDADTKQEYGTVTDVTHPAASDVYEVRNEQGEIFLFPAVKEFLGELKPEEGFITVRPIAGMFTSGGGNDDED